MKVVSKASNKLKVNIRKEGSVRKLYGDRSLSMNHTKKNPTRCIRKRGKDTTQHLRQRSVIELWEKMKSMDENPDVDH